jgi:hypothetical protein
VSNLAGSGVRQSRCAALSASETHAPPQAKPVGSHFSCAIAPHRPASFEGKASLDGSKDFHITILDEAPALMRGRPNIEAVRRGPAGAPAPQSFLRKPNHARRHRRRDKKRILFLKHSLQI